MSVAASDKLLHQDTSENQRFRETDLMITPNLSSNPVVPLFSRRSQEDATA